MSDEMVGRQIEQYRIDRSLGEGGMGIVYQATDIHLQRLVAIKVMHPHLAARREFRGRFLQEARAAASLDHPSIIRVLQFGYESNQLFLVMECILGGSLRDYIKRLRSTGKRLKLDETLELMFQCADALHYAHEQGMIHRDVKPDNVLLKAEHNSGEPVSAGFRAVLTDFGLAKLGESLVQSVTGQPMGTFPYMSPEQSRAEEVDHRTDIYALGIMLYELAVGELPFQPRSITEAIRMHVESPLPDQLDQAGLPPEVVSIIRTSLAKQRDDRYQTAREMARALREAKTGLPGVGATVIEAGETQLDSIGTYLMEEPLSVSVPQHTEQPWSNEAHDRLVIVSQGTPTRTVPLDKNVMTIGRNPDNDIVLPGNTVSGYHAQLDRTIDGDYVIIDLNSTNGTYLGQVQLVSNLPEHWDLGQPVRIGDAWLRLEKAPQQPQRTQHVQALTGAAAPRQRDPMYDTPVSVPSSDVTASLSPTSVEVEPGSRVDVEIQIVNQGATVEHFLVDVLDVPSAWFTAPTAAIQLLPGDSDVVRVSFHPPRSPRSVAGEYQFRVMVTGRRSDSAPTTVTGRLAILEFQGYMADIQPKRIKNTATTTLSATNMGNTATDFAVLTRDREDALDFTVRQPEFRLGPGQTAEFPVRMKPKKRPLLGTKEVKSFEIGISPVGEQPSQIGQTGELVVTPIIPVWVPAVAAALIAALVCAGALLANSGLVVLPPQRTATAEAVAQAQLSAELQTQTQAALWQAQTATANANAQAMTQTSAANANSATQVALTLTAASWTDTPAPTATPTNTPSPTVTTTFTPTPTPDGGGGGGFEPPGGLVITLPGGFGNIFEGGLPGAKVLVMDLVDAAEDAEWTTDFGQTALPFGGPDTDERGFAMYREDIRLEDGETYDRILQTHPKWEPNGRIVGDFELPRPIESGDRLVARVGFLDNSTNGDVAIRIAVMGGTIPSIPVVATVEDVADDGDLEEIDVDLSDYAGGTTIRMLVDAGSSSSQDWVAWAYARVIED